MRAVSRPSPAAVTGRHHGESLGVEASDEVGDGIAGSASDGAGRRLVVVAACDGQQDLGAGDLDGGGDLRSADLGQLLPLRVGQLAERVILFLRDMTASVNSEATRDTPGTRLWL